MLLQSLCTRFKLVSECQRAGDGENVRRTFLYVWSACVLAVSYCCVGGGAVDELASAIFQSGMRVSGGREKNTRNLWISLFLWHYICSNSFNRKALVLLAESVD